MDSVIVYITLVLLDAECESSRLEYLALIILFIYILEINIYHLSDFFLFNRVDFIF